jgi:nicotinamidase/pyrazinamidase
MNALLLIDLQVDFAPGGALPVPEGDQVVAIANTLMRKFDVVVATQDWHPANHGSFAANNPGRMPGELIALDGLEQILWPVHCVQDSNGAELLPGLNVELISHISRKGLNPMVDSYSGFFDNGHRQATGLESWLMQRGIDELVIMGLATDYCVKFTVLDALELGFGVTVVRDGCRGIDLHKGDVERAFAEMTDKGARVVMSSTV